MTEALTKPVNVLGPMVRGATLDQLADAGAKRISIGGALARAVLFPVLEAAKEMLETGSFDWTSRLVSGGEVARLFRLTES